VLVSPSGDDEKEQGDVNSHENDADDGSRHALRESTYGSEQHVLVIDLVEHLDEYQEVAHPPSECDKRESEENSDVRDPPDCRRDQRLDLGDTTLPDEEEREEDKGDDEWGEEGRRGPAVSRAEGEADDEKEHGEEHAALHVLVMRN
jgi:hypothetical protein